MASPQVDRLNPNWKWRMFDYLNLIEWAVALASLVIWARFSTFVSEDVNKNLVKQKEVPWNLGVMGILLLMFVVWVSMPSFWIALPLNLIIVGVFIAIYWKVRVEALGPVEGHLLKGFMASMNARREKSALKKNAAQAQLMYFRKNDQQFPLPRADDPLAAGLAAGDQLMTAALNRRAELVELAPTDAGYSCMMITDGFPSPQPAQTRQTGESAVQFFKTLAGLSLEERRKPQIGLFKTRDPEGASTTWTVRTSGSTAGERVSLSANEKSQWEFKLETIGLSTDQLAQLKTLTSDTKGVVVVATPKGHGRTSTLYALVRGHDAFTNSIYMFESNPQADIEGVSSVKFEPTGDTSYAKMLGSIILKDPTILMAADVNDAAAADQVVRFAAEGRVYVGLSAVDSFAGLERWLSMATDREQAVDTIRAVVAERLVRMLCPTCKVPYQADESTLKRLNLPIGKNIQAFKANTGPILDKKGNKIMCPDCGGVGFRGRTGIFEVLIVNDEMRKALAANANVTQLKAIARKHNMILLVEHGIRKFAAGITAINEVTRVVGEKPSPAQQRGKPAPVKK
ncbi:MAG TPA: ATPase, T2SS/T4P/T4SS family [Phycisphaerae bacterium]|nr:ATPase, T2SS/T4P/T4SS family [Phycisphaerae bacterium]